MKIKKSILNKLPNILAIISGGLLIILITIFAFIDNIDVYNKRIEGNVKTIDNYTCEKIEKEDTPEGVIVVYTFELDEDIDTGKSIAFYTLHQYTEVYIEDELIYSVKKSDKNFLSDTYGSDWILVPLGVSDEGKTVTIIITPAYDFVIDNPIDIFFGPSIVIYENIFKRDLPQLVLGVIAVFMGIIFVIVASYNWIKKEKGSNIFALGIFTILLGLWRITNVKFTPFLDFNRPTLFIYVAFASLMMIVPPLIVSIRGKYKEKTRTVLDVASIVISLLVLIEVILQLFGIVDLREMLDITNATIIISGILAISCSIYDRVKYKKGIGEPPDKNLIIIVIGGLLDIFFFYYNNKSTGLIGTLVAVNIYVILEGKDILFEYSNNEKKIIKQERELIDKELAIKMSQIQPHFLYNSLTSIHYLCDKDPKLAKKAIKWFSTYLRGNLESMSKDDMVPFEQEMNHIDIYLKLEKLRFGEYLDIIYNIEEKDFLIPTLSIQPLVENAVKYGVGDKKEGGQVIISSSSTDTHYIIAIEDTGVGFNINEEYSKDREHIGIENVKERLKMICDGELIIHSEIDKGTIAIIRIPKDYGGGVIIMKILAIDDEIMALESLLEAIKEVLPNEEIYSFKDVDEAIEHIKTNEIDIAFLDIKMRGITGIELAKIIKENHPHTNIIFTTGYSSFALSAFGVQASDYLLKPIEADQIKRALQNLRNPIKHNKNRIRVQCFGTFEVFIDDKPISFKRNKTKEVLAYLVDRMGANCTMGQLMTALWDDGEDTSSRQSNLRNLIADLKSTLNEYGIHNVINKNKNTISIYTNNIDCDFYDFINYKPYAINSYRGEYMSQYSWAEITLAKINKFA